MNAIAEKLVTQILGRRLSRKQARAARAALLASYRGADEARLRAAFGDLGLSDDSLRRLRDLLREK
jgi:hypothetical protein